MTEQLNLEDEKPATYDVSAGQRLAAARQALGISVEELADVIKVPVNVIEAIEKDKVPKNLPDTFIRGYIRSYARKVGVEESLVLPQVTTTGAYARVTTEQPDMQSFSRRTKRKALERRLTITTWIIAIVLVVAVVIWWIQDGGAANFSPAVSGTTTEQNESANSESTETELGTISASEIEAVATDEIDSPVGEAEASDVPAQIADKTDNQSEVTSIDEAAQPALDTQETQQNTASSTTEAQGVIETQTAQDNVADEAEAVTGQVIPEVAELTQEQLAAVADNGEVDEEGFMRVEMQFENDCWVEVYDINDERIAVGNKPAGYLMTLNAQGPFNVLLGNPVGVTIWVNGKLFDMSAYPSNRVARFELDVADL